MSSPPWGPPTGAQEGTLYSGPPGWDPAARESLAATADVFTLNPIALTGAPQTVKMPFPIPGGQAEIANESAYYLAVQIAGNTRWLKAWSADLFDLDQMVVDIQITPVLIGSAVNAPSQSLLISVATRKGAFQGTYPMPLDRQTSIAAGSVLIVGTPSVSIAGTPSVSIAGTPNVNIASGTVAISAGTVSIGNNVPVLNATGTQMAVKQPQTLLANYSVAIGATVTQDVTMPVDSHAIMVVRGGVIGTVPLTDQLLVQGNQSGCYYLSDSQLSQTHQINVAPISQLVDSTVHTIVKCSAGSLVAATVWVVAILDTEAVFAQSAGFGHGVQGIVMDSTALPLQVTMAATPALAAAAPAPWQAATNVVLGYARGLAANTAQQLLAAPGAGLRYYIHGYTLIADQVAAAAHGSLSLQDAAGVQVDSLEGPTLYITGSGGGAPLTVNSALNMKNTDTIAHDGLVSVRYSIG